MISRLLDKFLVLGVGALICSAPVNSVMEIQPAPYPEENLPDVWQPAPTLPGAIDWRTLIDIEVGQEKVDNFLQYVPNFTTELRAIDGKPVKLNGYMVPLSASEHQSHFILMAYPHACPFHMPGGPGGFVEIIADFPVAFTYEPILIEGHFQLLSDYSSGLFYRISAARKVEL